MIYGSVYSIARISYFQNGDAKRPWHPALSRYPHSAVAAMSASYPTMSGRIEASLQQFLVRIPNIIV